MTIKCDICLHKKVCKYKENIDQIQKMMDEVNEKDDILRIEMNCNQYKEYEYKLVDGLDMWTNPPTYKSPSIYENPPFYSY
nr:MAG TPA: hypothetical protein [Caudoviricetes sp.]